MLAKMVMVKDKPHTDYIRNTLVAEDLGDIVVNEGCKETEIAPLKHSLLNRGHLVPHIHRCRQHLEDGADDRHEDLLEERHDVLLKHTHNNCYRGLEQQVNKQNQDMQPLGGSTNAIQYVKQ